MANILEEVQRYVADKLNADEQLSGCTFLVENMKDIDYEIKKALGKQGLVGLVMTPKAVYQGKYEDLFLAWQLDELEIDIVENPIINRGLLSSYITGQDAAMRLFDVLCPAVGDSEGQFNPVSYEEGEDSGLIVNKCILKALVYGESQDPPQPTPSLNMRFVKLLDEAPPLSVTRQEGWMWPTEDGFVIWQDGEPKPLGGGVSYDEMSAYVDLHLSDYLPLSGGTVNGDVNVKGDIAFVANNNIMGMLTHSAGVYGQIVLSVMLDDNYSASITPVKFDGITNNTVLWPTEDGKFALTKEIPLSVSQLSNDSGYLTSADVEPYGPLLPGWARYAWQAGYVTTKSVVDNGVEFPVTLETTEEGTIGKAQISRTYFRNWSLYKYDTITYNPPLQMEWQYLDLYRTRSGRRTNVYKGYGWLTEKDSAGRQYAIAVARHSRDNDPTMLYYDAGVGTEFNMLVNVGYDNLFGTSLSGAGHTLSCTRITSGVTAKSTYLATVDEIPTLVSQLSNDAGYITSADIPPAQVSCIQDADRSIINANREFTTYYPTAPWTLYDDNDKVCELSCEAYDRWSYVEDEHRFVLNIEYNQYDQATWVLQEFYKEAEVWLIDNTYTTTAGTYDADSSAIQFNNSLYNATRKNIVSGILANAADIPLSVSLLSNDSGFITEASYIADNNGNRIDADRTVLFLDEFAWYENNNVKMTGTKTNSTFTNWYFNDSLVFQNRQWTFTRYVQGEFYGSQTIEGDDTDTELYFADFYLILSWKQETITDKLALESQLPTKTSDLSNDSGFITSADVPTKTSQLSNDSGFITNSDVKNSTITLTQGGVTKGSFTLNQSSDLTIALDAGGGGGDNGYTVTVNTHQADGNHQAGNVKIGGVNITIITGPGGGNRLEFDGYITSPGQKKFYSQTCIIVGNNDEPCVYVDGVYKNNTLVELSADAVVDIYNLVCIAGGTLVSLANGTKKPIEEVTYDDDLLVWNFDEGKLDSAKPTWIKRADYIFFHWKTDLASGKSINTCGQWGHRFFDLASNTWVYASDIEGKTIYTSDGADKVVSSKRIEGGKVYFYNIITKKHINLFCNDILAGCSLENKLYPVQNMKFVKDDRPLRPYSEFANDVPEYWFNDCRYAESNATREYLVEYYNRRKTLAV